MEKSEQIAKDYWLSPLGLGEIALKHKVSRSYASNMQWRYPKDHFFQERAKALRSAEIIFRKIKELGENSDQDTLDEIAAILAKK